MLAEHEEAGKFVEKGFDMNYAWEMYHLMVSIAQGRASSSSMPRYFAREWASYPNNVYRLRFLTNHDENSWGGTIDSLMGESQRMFGTLIFTAQGVPLIYNGQEACLDKKIKFFVKDPIKWNTCELTKFYTDLIKLKKENKALWNGDFGGKMIKIKTSRDKQIFAFYREKEGNRVVVLLNLTKKPVSFKVSLKDIEGEYTDYFSATKTTLTPAGKLNLDSWGFKVFVR
jgi:glycosidase